VAGVILRRKRLLNPTLKNVVKNPPFTSRATLPPRRRLTILFIANPGGIFYDSLSGRSTVHYGCAACVSSRPFSFALHFRPQGLVPAARRGLPGRQYRGRGNTLSLALSLALTTRQLVCFRTVRSLAVGAGRDDRLLSSAEKSAE
jgi:hypothetical protein